MWLRKFDQTSNTQNQNDLTDAVEKGNLKKVTDPLTETQNITFHYTRCKDFKNPWLQTPHPILQDTTEK
jgi:hypothetical protein